MGPEDWTERILARRRPIYGSCSWPRILGILVFILRTLGSLWSTEIMWIAFCFEITILAIEQETLHEYEEPIVNVLQGQVRDTHWNYWRSKMKKSGWIPLGIQFLGLDRYSDNKRRKWQGWLLVCSCGHWLGIAINWDMKWWKGIKFRDERR